MSQLLQPTTDIESWEPRTRLGRMVKEGLITSIDEIFKNNLRIKEPEIIDILLPELYYEIVNVNIVQRQTDAGEKSRFQVLVCIGNKDGYVGVGLGKHAQIRYAIQNAIRDAKLNIIPVLRGCGSWECRCDSPHSIPFRISGKCGSVRITLFPAPRGTGLVAAEVPRKVLELAGIKDIRSFSRGHTKTTINFCKATFNALKNLLKFTTF